MLEQWDIIIGAGLGVWFLLAAVLWLGRFLRHCSGWDYYVLPHYRRLYRQWKYAKMSDTEVKLAAAHDTIHDMIAAPQPPLPSWTRKDFNMLMWLGTATTITMAVFPWGIIAYPVLGLLAEHYESKNDV